jgi:hypothetical protein
LDFLLDYLVKDLLEEYYLIHLDMFHNYHLLLLLIHHFY